MSEREDLIAKVTAEAEKKAKKQGLNQAQTKLFVDEEVKKVVEDMNKKQEKNKIPVVQIKTQAKENKTENTQENTENKETKYIVHTPVKNYCGEVAGVQFAYGKAEVKPGWILNWFIEHGYKVEEVGN